MDKLRRQETGAGKSGRARAQKMLKFIFLFFVFMWMLLTFVRSDFFSLENIIISGYVHLTEAEIEAALQVSEGENIWRIRPSLLQERVESIPRVSSAAVERRLPGTLIVSVLEEDTLILVPYREHMLELGTDGQVLGSTRERKEYSLPLLTGTGPVEVSVGHTLLAGEQLTAVRAVMTSLTEHGLHASEINLADPENMVLIMIDGLIVWLGRGEYEEKIWLLRQISRRLPEERQTGYLDLRIKDAPVYSAGGGKKRD